MCKYFDLASFLFLIFQPQTFENVIYDGMIGFCGIAQKVNSTIIFQNAKDTMHFISHGLL